MLRTAATQKASDLHLVVASPPLLRVNGYLVPVSGSTPLNANEINQAFLQVTTPEQRESFHRNLELDFNYTLAGVGHLRCNAAQQRGAISLAIRLLPAKIPTIDEMELPQLYKELALKQRGLIIVTGPTGSGKSTSQAAMIQHLNENDARHIVTIEDPIEYVHPSLKCAVTQRQLGTDTLSFPEALRRVLRQDPDVILVGEMRDLETASAVLSIAETGHLIMTTGHAPGACQAVERVVDLFPPHERPLAQARLASLLIAVLFQTLVPRASGSGRVAAVEILIANPAARNLIREGKTHQLPNIIRTHRSIGMISLDESLVDLYFRRIITRELALTFAHDRQETEKLISGAAVRNQAQQTVASGAAY